MPLAALLTLLTVSSCEKHWIFEGEGDCGIYYHIGFEYNYNMKFADAFAHEVNSLALYVFNQEGILMHEYIESDKTKLSSGNFEIPLELKQGEYELLVWAGLMNQESFTLMADTQVGKTKIEELKTKLNRKTDASGNALVTEEILPLYHGYSHLSVADEPGIYTKTISLMKNTNSVRVVLQELSDNKVDADRYIFEISEGNGAFYNWDNSFLNDQALKFSPWSVSAGTAEMPSLKATESVSVALAEFTIGRMRAGKSAILKVKDKETGKDVLRIPIGDYALLTKGNYNKNMSDQEFLDRQDEYVMTFFLNQGEWVNSVIYINSWRVVINNTELN